MSNKVKEWVGQRTKTINGVLETADLYGEFNEALATIITNCIKDLDLDSQWISVEDKLPEEGQTVNIFNGNVFTGGYDFGSKVFFEGGGYETVHKVTHWMPLPPAP